MQLLTINNLDVGYNNTLIEGINLNISSPKVISLMGKNGIGKSCFLRTLSGLAPAKKGEILINNESLNDKSVSELSKLISVLLTDRINLEYLTVEELVLLGRTPYSNWNNDYSKNDISICNEALELLHITDLKKSFFSNLSDGQKQKVLLAKAIAQTPKILLLDEPTTFLDIPSKIEFLHLLKKIAKEKELIIVMSTHETIHFKEIVDEVWIVDEKKLKTYTPEEVISSGVFKKLFGLDLN